MIAVPRLSESVTVNNVFQGSYSTNYGGNATFSWKPTSTGQYQIEVKFPGQSYYANTSVTIMVSVTKRNVVLSVNSSPQNPVVGQQVDWDVYAYDMMDNYSIASRPVTLFINGSNETVAKTNSTGYAVFKPSPSYYSPQGTYNITFVSASNQTYNSATSYDPLNVYLNTSLTIQAGTITVDQQNSISVTLKDQNGNPLASRTVQVSINGVSFANVTTGSNGQASFNWSPSIVGNYTIGASYTATGSMDTGYMPASASTVVNVKPQIIINTQTTGSGTQSVTFNTAQGSAQSSSSSPSISIQFSSNGVSITASFGGSSLTASAVMTTQFKVACAATLRTVFGSFCAMTIPVELIHFDLSVAGVVSIDLVSRFLGGIQSVSVKLLAAAPPQVQDLLDAFGNGVDASALVATAGVATLASITGVSLGTAFLAAEDVAAAVVLTGMGAAAGAGRLIFGWNTATYKSYLLGLLTPALGGLGCAVVAFSQCNQAQEFDVPENLPNFLVANSFWAAYELGGVLAPLVIWDLSPAIIWGAALLIPIVLLGLQN